MKRNLVLILIAAFLLAACGARAMRASVPPTEAPPYLESYGLGGGGDGAYPQEMPLAAMPTPMATMEAYKAMDSSAANVDAASRERMVVKNADLSIVVKDPEAEMTAISKLADEMGGYVVSMSLYQSTAPNGTEVTEGQVVIRVPTEKLTEALEKIKADAVEVQSENVSGQDVTSQYVDLESQLKNLEAAEKQLMEIMSKAEKTEDVLNVYNQLVAIRGQIESIKGQMKYLEETSSTSSISARLIAEETVQPIEIAGWKPEGTARDAIQNLIFFWQDFVDFLIVFVLNFLPKLLTILLVFGLPIWLIVRAVRYASRRRKAAQEKKEEAK